MMGVPTPTHPEDLDVSDATFRSPDLTTFCRLDELGLVVVGQHLKPDAAVLECRVIACEDDPFCRRCGAEGTPRGGLSCRRRSSSDRSRRCVVPGCYTSLALCGGR